MTLRVAVQMDPLMGVNPKTDTTYGLITEAVRRGHEVWHYPPEALSQDGTRIFARMQPVVLGPDRLGEGEAAVRDLADFDVVWLRQDPPFDMAYLSTTYMLEQLPPSTRVVNNPTEVRNCPEKLFVTQFADLMPPTLISRDPEALADFRARHTDVVLKPLYGWGGGGVFLLRAGDSNFDSVLEMLLARDREPLIAQAFLPEVAGGDKRIVLVNGEPCGVLNRVPAAGHVRSNLAVGGRGELAELSAHDREICARLRPELQGRGLMLVGIDVIGPYLTEINVTSPTGPVVIRDLGGPNALAKCWDVIEGS